MSRNPLFKRLTQQPAPAAVPKVAYATGETQRSTGGNWVVEATTPPTAYSPDAGKLAMFDVNGRIQQCGGMWFVGTQGTGRSSGFLENAFAADATTYGVFWPVWTAGTWYMALTANSDGSLDVADLTTVGLDSGSMLRVAASGGLEERTPAEVLADIGAAAAADLGDAAGLDVGTTAGTVAAGDHDHDGESPTFADLTISTGDVEVSTIGAGIILHSATKVWRVTVDDTGALTTTDITPP